jgi:hypothetical protein
LLFTCQAFNDFIDLDAVRLGGWIQGKWETWNMMTLD